MVAAFDTDQEARPVFVKARPFVKMLGGKTRLLPELVKRMPETFGMYFEPFVGGGALFFAQHTRDREAEIYRPYVLGDANEDLVIAYREIRSNLPELIRRLKGMKNTERFFKAAREVDVEALRFLPGGDSARAARFIFLNKTCFNGLHRVNRRGMFNVPFGHYDNPTICDESNLHACADALSTAKICHDGFVVTSRAANEDDFVYFDPPYLPLSETSNFTGYTEHGFGWSSHVELAEHAKALAMRGVHVLLSNSDHPRIRKLYKDLGFKIEKVYARRNVNSDGAKRGAIAELLISGGGR